MLLEPLLHGSRGDQLRDARAFTSKGWAMAVGEDELRVDGKFLQCLQDLAQNAEQMRDAQQSYEGSMASAKIAAILRTAVSRPSHKLDPQQ